MIPQGRFPFLLPGVEHFVHTRGAHHRMQGYQLEAIHQYHLPDGVPFWWVVRMESTSTPRQPKRIFPLQRTDTGFEFRRPEFGKSGAPLYNLHLLQNYPKEVVYLVEGEKAADCLTKIGIIATTWPNGAAALGRADLTPLAGRNLVCWPDNDEPGHNAMQEAQARLHMLGALALLLDVESLGLPPKGDAVDWLERFEKDCSGSELCAIPGGLEVALREVQALPIQKISEPA